MRAKLEFTLGRIESLAKTWRFATGITDDGRSNSTEEKESTLFKFFLEYIFALSKAIFHSKIWLKSKFRYIDKRKKYFNITFKELKFFYFIRNLKEIWKYHLQCDPLKLFFVSESMSENYFDIISAIVKKIINVSM